MDKFIIAGIGTDVGKTLVSAIFVSALGADYWKPVASGGSIDSDFIKENTSGHVFPSSYEFSHPLSPHHAARLEGLRIDQKKIITPNTNRPIIIEMSGGICTPLSPALLNLDLFAKWEATWIVVSRHYLGSINHTLLTLSVLQQYSINPFLIFNGKPNPDTEEAITTFSSCPILGHLDEEENITPTLIKEYGKKWSLQHKFGNLTPK